MAIVKPRIQSGFMELNPSDQIIFNRMLDTIRGVYELFGFTPVETPAIELSEILFAKGGGETEQEVYRFERGGRDMALRYDLTVPTARYVAQYEGELSFPFRRYAIGKVWRAERAQAGRFREFYQCDIDIIGSDCVLYDAEVPSVIYATMRALGFTDFTIRVNNRKTLNGLFAELGAGDQSVQVMRVVDKLEKIGSEEVRSQLATLGMSSGAVERLMTFLAIDGSPDDVIAGLRALDVKNDLFQEGVDELTTILEAMRGFGIPEENFRLDLAIARGLDYYTGTVYETVLNDYPGVGSVCSGGRYDDLASYYTKTRLPGVGISIGLTRLFYKLREAGVVESGSSTPSRVLLCPIDETGRSGAIKLASQLREAGISTQIYLEVVKLAKQLRYADRLGVPCAVIVGEKEVAEDVYTVKDMVSGEQDLLTIDALIKKLS
ncbi:histidine--tRNA ligase [bacterium]|jgi:histidyl-tRNA synthetase|nr:MAG: histidine--tRNA ligase [bacterium]